jgi:hypothetical protein
VIGTALRSPLLAVALLVLLLAGMRPPLRRRLDAGEEAALTAAIERGPTSAAGCRPNMARHPSSMGRVLRRLGFSRQKARPHHPKRDAEAQAAFKKEGLPSR